MREEDTKTIRVVLDIDDTLFDTTLWQNIIRSTKGLSIHEAYRIARELFAPRLRYWRLFLDTLKAYCDAADIKLDVIIVTARANKNDPLINLMANETLGLGEHLNNAPTFSDKDKSKTAESKATESTPHRAATLNRKGSHKKEVYCLGYYEPDDAGEKRLHSTDKGDFIKERFEQKDTITLFFDDFKDHITSLQAKAADNSRCFHIPNTCYGRKPAYTLGALAFILNTAIKSSLEFINDKFSLKNAIQHTHYSTRFSTGSQCLIAAQQYQRHYNNRWSHWFTNNNRASLIQLLYNTSALAGQCDYKQSYRILEAITNMLSTETYSSSSELYSLCNNARDYCNALVQRLKDTTPATTEALAADYFDGISQDDEASLKSHLKV